MRTPAARLAIAVAALAAAVALFFVLARGDDGTATARQTPQTTTRTSTARSAVTTPQSAPVTTKREAARPPKPAIARIWIREGKPAGGAKRLGFTRGETVRFSVHSTVPDEVHIHGFEISKALPANRIVQFAFPADIEGVFDVELHEADVKIAELRIKP